MKQLEKLLVMRGGTVRPNIPSCMFQTIKASC